MLREPRQRRAVERGESGIEAGWPRLGHHPSEHAGGELGRRRRGLRPVQVAPVEHLEGGRARQVHLGQRTLAVQPERRRTARQQAAAHADGGRVQRCGAGPRSAGGGVHDAGLPPGMPYGSPHVEVGRCGPGQIGMHTDQPKLVGTAAPVRGPRCVVVERAPRARYREARQHAGAELHVRTHVQAEHLAIPGDRPVAASARQVAVVAAAPGCEAARAALFAGRRQHKRGIAQHLLERQRLRARRGPTPGDPCRRQRQAADHALCPLRRGIRKPLADTAADRREGQRAADLGKDGAVDHLDPPFRVIRDGGHSAAIGDRRADRVAELDREPLGTLHQIVGQGRHGHGEPWSPPARSAASLPPRRSRHPPSRSRPRCGRRPSRPGRRPR